MYCPKCGTKNREDAIYCENCGTKLDGSGSHQVPRSQRISDSAEDKKPSSVIVIIGYIFALLGGLIGIAIGAYLYTRNNKDAKFHGRNILVIGVIILLVSIVAGVFFIDSDTLSSETSGQEGWHSVANFNGVEDTNTSSFHIKGDKFKVKISATSDSEYGYFALFVYPYPKNVTATYELHKNFDIESTTVTKEYEVSAGPGDYYIKLYAANLSNWNIEVFDYY